MNHNTPGTEALRDQAINKPVTDVFSGGRPDGGGLIPPLGVKPIILDLCGGSGAWSKPWADSGNYDVRVITLPEYDVRTYEPPTEGVYGVMAAPPCTAFSIASARLWPQKDLSGETAEAIQIVRACLKIIEKASPEWWALENPAGRSRIFRLVPELGKPRMVFDPCDYGDKYTKKTGIWGKNYRIPWKFFSVKRGQTDYIPDKVRKTCDRSKTPPGFARAFYEANKKEVNHGN